MSNTLYMIKFNTESGDEFFSPVLAEKPTQQQIKNYAWKHYDHEFELFAGEQEWSCTISWEIIETACSRPEGKLEECSACPDNIDWNGM